MASFRLKRPLILGFRRNGIWREEAIDELSFPLRTTRLDHERMAEHLKLARSLQQDIDWGDEKPWSVAELADYDLEAWLAAHYRHAKDRALRFLRAKEAAGGDPDALERGSRELFETDAE